ncbi:chorismate mutase [Fistulina hepatica ATCC 64428]|uniref:Chorismate mutase n=1 Tax=Fistulina hepatica ATCC 64428 TaxID=1128425 RepID=A0A0D7A4H3_9AGAR|nr:chorismate mutase [Fistulina hepatica ATCC 64428]
MISNLLAGDPLSLDHIRSVLAGLEETIIFSLVERAQFAHNPRMYKPGTFDELKQLGFDGSWLEWILKETETFQAKARRYTSPDEYPFTANLPDPIIAPLPFPKFLHPNNINVNPSILSFYVHSIVPRVTRRATLALAAAKRARGIVGDAEYEDDGNYGSTAIVDVQILQAISKRVHYGKFVSEVKFIENPAAFISHIETRNRQALEGLITKPAVERKLLQRLAKKAATYALEFSPDGEVLQNGDSKPADGKLDVDGVVDLYESYIIPLTKEVEVDYLLQRLDGISPEEIDKMRQGGPAQK